MAAKDIAKRVEGMTFEVTRNPASVGKLVGIGIEGVGTAMCWTKDDETATQIMRLLLALKGGLLKGKFPPEYV